MDSDEYSDCYNQFYTTVSADIGDMAGKVMLELMEKAGVIVTPGASFGPHGEGYVRFALVLPPEKIKEAVESIRTSGI